MHDGIPSGIRSPRTSEKTQVQIEAAIYEEIRRFVQEFMGTKPKDIHAHLISDLVVVRLQGILAPAEQHLAKTTPADNGVAVVKKLRRGLIETARPILETLVRDATGVPVLSLHHDVSTLTGEEVVVFTLAEPPVNGQMKNRSA
jgi:uncharacterized protein YbcI